MRCARAWTPPSWGSFPPDPPPMRTSMYSASVVRKHSRFPVTHGSGLRASNSHLLCSVMLLDERFARPRADLHHRPKRSDIRRQGHDSPAIVFRDCLDNTSCSHSASRAYVPPTAESSKDFSVLQRWAHHDKLRLALIDRSAKLVEPSLCLDSPCITAILAHTLSDAALTPPLTAASNSTARLPLVVLSSPPVQSPSDLSRPERRSLL